MTHDSGDGLVVDAEVRRGGFTLAVSLTAAPGQVVGVLGPNGAGKSTLLSAIAGLTPVSAGRITLGGQVMDDADAGTRLDVQAELKLHLADFTGPCLLVTHDPVG